MGKLMYNIGLTLFSRIKKKRDLEIIPIDFNILLDTKST